MFYVCLFTVQVWTRSLSHKPTFNDDVFRRPLLVEGGEAAMLADTHNMLSEVKVLGIKAQQAEPQLPHRLSVLPILWPATGLHRKEMLLRDCATGIFTKAFTVYIK